jgi:hypothetical protein
LVPVGHAHVAEDDRPDEDVVDRQALLDQVPGQVLTGRRATGHDTEQHRERQTERDPHAGLDRGGAHGDRVRVAVDDEQVADQQDGDPADERAPRPPGHGEVDEAGGGGERGRGHVALAGRTGRMGDIGPPVRSQRIHRRSPPPRVGPRSPGPNGP